MSRQYVTEEGTFANKPVLQIYGVDENGQRSEHPVISFGAVKAQAVLANIDAIRKFLDSVPQKQNKKKRDL